MSDDVIVLGGGWSVSQFNLRGIEERGFLIGCNESAILTKCAAALTMDRLWAEHRYATLCTQGVPEIYLRAGIDKHFSARPTTQKFRITDDYEAEINRKRKDPDHVLYTRMATDKGFLNGSNTGTCALNLAFQKAPSRVFLLGFDMCRGPGHEPYWHSSYSWNPDGATRPPKYVEWAKEFDDIAQQFTKAGIDVFNVNNRSAIEAFRKISFETFLRMTF